MPDGTRVRFPDNMPKEQIRDMIASKFPEVTQPAQATERGFISGLQDKLGRRKDQYQLAEREAEQGRQTGLEREIQQIGAVLGGVGDIGGSVIGAGAKGVGKALDIAGNLPLPGLKDYQQTMGGQIQQAVQSPLSQKIGSNVGSAIRTVAEKYGEFAEENPRATRNIESLANIGLFAAPLLKRGKEATGAIKGVGKATIGKLAKPEKIDSESLRTIGGELFKKADEVGALLNPKITNKFLDNMSSKAPQTQAGRIFAGDNEVTSLIQRTKSLKNKPLTFQGAKEIDEILGDLAYKNLEQGKFNAQGKAFLDMQRNLRNIIEEAPASDFVGGKEAFEIAKDAKNYWSTSLKLRDIERIIENSEYAQVPASAIKAGFKQLIKNDNKLMGFNELEKQAIRNAAKTGVMTDLLSVMGSRLSPIVTGSIVGAGTMNPLAGLGAATANYGLTSGARKLATAGQMRKAKIVEDLIKSRIKGSAQRTPLTPAINKLLKEVGIVATPSSSLNAIIEQLKEIKGEE